MTESLQQRALKNPKLMKIAILNDFFFTPEHLNRLKKIGEVVIYSNTTSENLAIERLKNSDIAVVASYLTPYPKTVLEHAHQLKLLVTGSVGFNTIDIEYAKARGIQVANIPGYNKQAVAEHTIALMFAMLRNIPMGNKRFRAHPVDDLDPSSDEGKSFIGYEIFGKKFGIIGLGNTGSAVAKLAHGLGMNVIGYNRSPKNIQNVKQIPLNDVVKISDIISIHLALNNETRHIIGAKELSLMKPHAILINMGRAGHVDTEALYKALKEKRIFGAALDMTDIPYDNHPILSLENAVFAPHTGVYTQEALYHNCPEMIVQNIEAFVQGQPFNIVNP